MITIQTIQTRLSLEVPFYISTVPSVGAALEQIVANSTNYAAPPTFSISEDGLTHTSIATYESQAQLDAFLAEMAEVLPTFFQDRDAYCAGNNIVVNRVIITS